MRMIMIMSALLVAACDRDKPPAPSAEQSGQLNEAEDMLNDMAKEAGPPKEEGPAAEATDPSTNSD